MWVLQSTFIKAARIAKPCRSPYLAVQMQAACSLLMCWVQLRLLPWWVRQHEGLLQSTAKLSAQRALQKHTLLIYEEYIAWPEGVWIKTHRRLKINPGVYMWSYTQVMLEIRGRLWAAVTVSFLSCATTPVAVLFQVMRKGSSPIIIWDGRQPHTPCWRLVVGIADQQQLAFLVRIQL